MEIATLSQIVSQHARSLCRELLPEGVVEGNNFRIGDVYGEKGKSMSIRLDGENAGEWKDFESGDGGDLIDLVSKNLGIPIKDSMEWLKRRYGIKDDTPRQISKVTKPKTVAIPTVPAQSNTGELHRFLEKRGFRDVGEICVKYKILETESLGAGVDCVFRFFDQDGKLIFVKNKPLNYESHPGTCHQKDLKQILLGWHTFPLNSRTLWLVEGEMDYIAATELGFPALSLPMGSNGMSWIDTEWENLELFSEIVIATDQDDAGNKCAETIEKRLGDRCLRINFPAKDINDLLVDHGMDVAKSILKDAYENAKWTDPSSLQNVANFADDVDAFFDAAEGELTGFASGWDKIDDEDVRFRSGELWGVSGINGSGKSMWLNQLSLNAIKQGKKVLIASMEMTPRYTLGRMMRQATAQRIPAKEHRGKTLDWLSPNLWLFVDTLTPKPDDLLKVFEYAYRRYGIDVFIIDSMTNLVRHDDYQGQQVLMEKLVNFKLAFNTTLFLVTHARKGESEDKAPGKFDVKGSGAITDLADGFLSVWKNKRKAEHLNICKQSGAIPDEEITKMSDVIVEILKNRHGMFEGRCGFYFDEPSCQYLERQSSTARAYVKSKASPIF